MRRAALAVGLAFLVACGPPPDSTSSPATLPATTAATTPRSSLPTSDPPPSTVLPTSATSLPATTVSTTPTSPPATGLRPGATGPVVLALQQQLSALGYWLGEPDGEYGDATTHAVVALQKAAGLARDGIVGPATRAALDRGARPAAASTAGHVVEIDLSEQLLLVVDDGAVSAVFDTSTGRVDGTTPRGHWVVEREIDGLRRSALGLLYRPKYFHGGVAVHGYTSVPAHPASHGCVRVTYAAMDHLWSSSVLEVGTAVWVY